MVKNLPAKMWIHSLGREDSLEKGMATHSNILAWEIMDREAWKAIVHGIAKESDNFLATKHPLGRTDLIQYVPNYSHGDSSKLKISVNHNHAWVLPLGS